MGSTTLEPRRAQTANLLFNSAQEEDLAFHDYIDQKRERENWPNMYDAPGDQLDADYQEALLHGTAGFEEDFLPDEPPASSPDQPRALAALDAVGSTLATITNVPDALDVRNKAEAVRKYLKDAKQGLEAQNAAALVKLLAERRVGELLAEMEKNAGGRPAENQSHAVTGFRPPTLEELGISKMQSSRFQAVAKLSEPQIHSLAAECNDGGRELTQSLALTRAKGKRQGQKPALSDREQRRKEARAGERRVPWIPDEHWPGLPETWWEFQDSDDEPCDPQMWLMMAKPLERFVIARAEFLAAYSAEPGTDACRRQFTSKSRKYVPEIQKHLTAIRRLMDQWYEDEPKSDGKRCWPH